MDISQFDYSLPEHLIAQFPIRRRDQSRLLILDRASGQREYGKFDDVLRFISSGDVLVVNDTRVFKARLLGQRTESGGVEILLVRLVDDSDGEIWEAMARPSRRLKRGQSVKFGSVAAELLKDKGEGRWLVRFANRSQRRTAVSRFGHVPLPPYISRDDQPSDVRRYQTLFADSSKTGAVAAPTAGFHFTKGLLKRLSERKVVVVKVTLHVGPGTFRPIQGDTIDNHAVDAEWAELTPFAAEQINRAREKGRVLFAVGTTAVRTLESANITTGEIQPFAGMVNLYIKPGHKFRTVDHLITNFHLPRSSLLVLVSAFAGRDRIMAAYRDAIEREYRFYSYGDAMLIL